MSTFDFLTKKYCSVCGLEILDRVWWEKTHTKKPGKTESKNEYVHLDCMSNHPKFKKE